MVGALLSGCRLISGPSEFDIPAEDMSLDPARLRIGGQLFFCGQWNPVVGKPAGSAVFVDAFFSGGLELPLLDHPLAVHRHIVEMAGAIVVRSYKTPGFRLWMPTDSIRTQLS